MLYLDNVPASEACLLIERRPARPIPRRKQLRWDVPGRSGALIVPLDAWENVSLTYELAVLPTPGVTLESAVDAAVAFLTAPGYRRLADTCWPGVFYLAACQGGQELADVLHRARRARVAFDAMPQRWRTDGETAVLFTAAGTVWNPTKQNARPLLRLTGSGAGALTIGSSTLTLADPNNQTLDCAALSAVGGGAVSGAWPILPPGASAIGFTGGVTGVSVVPRWYDI